MTRIALLVACVAGPAIAAIAADCTQTSVGFTPLNDLGTGLYLGQYPGGLYPGGSNVPPPAHHAEGLARADAIGPLGPGGQPAADGQYVLLSIGMSNTTQEFCAPSGTDPCQPWTFMGQAADHPDVNHETLVIANGARGGQAAQAWISPTSPEYDRIRDQVLPVFDATEAQVVAVWVKQANPGPSASLPSAQADAFSLEGHLGAIARAVTTRYPNCRQIFFSSRIYAGYASTQLNPEPYAYESGFAVKWTIEAQIDQLAGAAPDPIAGDLDLGVASWLAWGAYPWADGLVARSDGLTWACGDFSADGTHPATAAEEKVGGLLLDFFLGSPYTAPWFATPGCAADVNGDETVSVEDVVAVIESWGACADPCPPCPADVDGDCQVDVNDLVAVITAWGACS